MLVEEDLTYGKPTKKTHLFPPNSSPDDFIPLRREPNYVDSYFRTGWEVEITFRNKEGMRKRQKFENLEEMKHVREKLAKYFIEKYERYTQGQLDDYLTFAQRMRDNTTTFQTFYSANTITN